MKRMFLFLGKGGVGKTTLAGSLAKYLSREGQRVFLASIDPAHSLFDFFGRESKTGCHELGEGLFVEELDLEHYLARLIKEISTRIKRTYRYLQVLNVEDMIDLIRYSPGIEEYVMLHMLYEIFNTWKDRTDYIIVDTPPTGLMLRIFSLPKASLVWIDKLKWLRSKILERRSQIVHIKGEKALGEKVSTDLENDEVFQQLKFQQEIAQKISYIFSDSTVSQKILVVNFDELSIKEAIRIIQALETMGIGVDLVVFNKKGEYSIPNSVISRLLSATGRDLGKVEIPLFKEGVTTEEKMIKIAKSLDVLR